jgi:microcompartment protein CcmL/EutN
MTGNALGFIEAIGLTAAIEAADSAVKSANVRLLGYELARGDGMTTVKIEGDVGAVKAAVKAAEAAAAKVGRVVSTHVIPRPAEGTRQIVLSRETVGLDKAEKTAARNVSRPAKAPPESAKAPPEPAAVPPESAKAPSEPVAVPPESAKAVPEPVAVSPEPAAVPPESAKAPPESGRSSAEPKDVKKPRGQSKKTRSGVESQPKGDNGIPPFELEN